MTATDLRASERATPPPPLPLHLPRNAILLSVRRIVHRARQGRRIVGDMIGMDGWSDGRRAASGDANNVQSFGNFRGDGLPR